MDAQAPRPDVDALAAGQIDDTDIRVLTRLGSLFSVTDPVPDGLVDRIQFGITLDALHAEIAELQRSGEFVGVRSQEATQAQTVTFTSASLTTMVTVTPTSADRVRIDGWIAPGGGFSVELRAVGQTLRTSADENGRFALDDVPRGLAQFVLQPAEGAEGSSVITPTIEI